MSVCSSGVRFDLFRGEGRKEKYIVVVGYGIWEIS
jgi:hypothetical protein